VSIAHSLASLDRLYDSLEYFELALDAKPSDNSVVIKYARALERAGCYVEAARAYEELSRRGHGHYERDLNRLATYMLHGSNRNHALRFRGAFSARSTACICCGSDVISVLFADRCAEVIYEETGFSLDVRNSTNTSARTSADGGRFWATRVSKPEYEFCFILPEALLDRQMVLPSSVLQFSYLDTNRLESLNEKERQQRYVKWLSSLLDIPRSSFRT
jgi:tetratricopeptide (TPR) repeat protein